MAELEQLARRDGRPTSQVIREALDLYVAGRREERRTLPGFVGIAHGPGTETGAAADEVEEVAAPQATLAVDAGR